MFAHYFRNKKGNLCCLERSESDFSYCVRIVITGQRFKLKSFRTFDYRVKSGDYRIVTDQEKAKDFDFWHGEKCLFPEREQVSPHRKLYETKEIDGLIRDKVSGTFPIGRATNILLTVWGRKEELDIRPSKRFANVWFVTL